MVPLCYRAPKLVHLPLYVTTQVKRPKGNRSWHNRTSETMPAKQRETNQTYLMGREKRWQKTEHKQQEGGNAGCKKKKQTTADPSTQTWYAGLRLWCKWKRTHPPKQHICSTLLPLPGRSTGSYNRFVSLFLLNIAQLYHSSTQGRKSVSVCVCVREREKERVKKTELVPVPSHTPTHPIHRFDERCVEKKTERYRLVVQHNLTSSSTFERRQQPADEVAMLLSAVTVTPSSLPQPTLQIKESNRHIMLPRLQGEGMNAFRPSGGFVVSTRICKHPFPSS